jgi:ATP adenylyltransferase
LAYVTRSDEKPGCIFCRDRGEQQSELLIFSGRTAFVILNLYPYNPGHLMVVPKRHVGSLAETHPDELSELMELTRRAEIALGEEYRPQGLNVGLNLGRSAGAGVLDHLHFHVVPRWNGDTNFMSVIGESRVLPESLDRTAARLRPVFERLDFESPVRLGSDSAGS